MSSSPSMTFEQLKAVHAAEAEKLGWKAHFTTSTGSITLSVTVIPENPQVVKDGAIPLYYHYRFNPVTGMYTLLS